VVQSLVCLPLDPKVAGSSPAEAMDFQRRWEVKPEVPCRKILQHIKDLLQSHEDGKTKFSFPSPTLPLPPEMSRMAGNQTVLVAATDVPADRTAGQYWGLPERSGRQVGS
jgi:hypothetical protein